MKSLDSRCKVVVLGFLFFLAWIHPARSSPKPSLHNLTSNSDSSLRVGDILVSPSNLFQLEIKEFKDISKTFLCIHYAEAKHIVWVLREQNRVTQYKPYLKLSKAGALQLSEMNSNNELWNSGTTTASVARLLDTGNLVLEDDKGKRVWESFNYSITDTLLPGQYMISTDPRRNNLTSWASEGNPTSGTYIFGWGNAALFDGTTVSNVLRLLCTTCEVKNATEAVYIPGRDVNNPHIITNASSVFFHQKMGGLYFPTNSTSTSILPPAPTVILSDFQQPSNTTLKRLTLDTDGGLRIWQWQIGQSSSWTAVANWVVTERGSQCYAMGTCGNYSLCNMTPSNSLDRVQCRCLEGFDPKEPSRGCERKENVNCQPNAPNFTMVELPGIDMPWGGDYDNKTLPDLATCKAFCADSCNCTGVVYSKDEQSCWRRMGNLYNLGYPTEATHGSDRVAIIKVANYKQPEEKKDSRLWIIAPVLGGVLGVGILVFCICRFRRSLRRICGGVCTKTGPDDHGIPEHFGGSDHDQPQQLGSH